MATLDDLCEAFDEFKAPGDTPMRFKLDGEWLELAAVHKEPDGTITVELEQDVEPEPQRRERRAPDSVPVREASIHWGGDGI